MALTPDQKRELERDIKVFDSEWDYNPSTKEIYRKKKQGFKKFISFFWKRRYKVIKLYRWAMKTWATPQLMPFSIPIKRDDIKKPKSSPDLFQLTNEWSIPRKDLKTLTHGPLFNSDGKTLVKSGGMFSYYWNKVWPIIVGIAIILGLIRSIVWLLDVVSK